MRSNYKKLGEYIRIVDERNRDLAITNLQGVSITKEFVPSIANIIGTDLSKYKIVRTGQFAYGPVTSRNGDKVSIALLKGEDCIISSSYVPFEVYKPEELLPEYLMLWFMRSEFDRYARFMSNGSAREVFDWDCMCGVELPVPSIDEQRKIVHDYQVITDRIELLRKMNENLEEQIMAIYHQTFDDGVCHEETVSKLGDVIGGATPSTNNPEYFCENGIVWLSPKDLTGTGLKFIFRGETDITEEGYNSCSTKILPKGTVLLTSRAPVGSVAIAMGEMCTNQGFKSIVPKEDFWTEYIYCLLKDSKQLLEANASGTTFLEISGNTLKNLTVPIPDDNTAKQFSDCCRPLFQQQMLFEKEYMQLSSLADIRISLIVKGA